MLNQNYPSDLTDSQWEHSKELLPTAKRQRRPRELDMRQVVNAILYVVAGGIQWRMLPREFPKWQSVYYYFRLWRKQHEWQRLHDRVRAEVRRTQGRHKHPTAGCLDSQSVQTTQVPGVRGWVDGGYRGSSLATWVTARFRFVLQVVLRSEEQPGFVVLPRRWVVERTFACLNLHRRLSKDYEVLTDTSEAMIYIALTRLMLRRLKPL